MSDSRQSVDLKYFMQQLLQEKREIEADLKAGEGASAAVTLDQTSVGRVSRVDALQAQAISIAARVQRLVGLRNIDASLMRISEGDYGYCLECGELIALLRLEANLSTQFCIECASKREQAKL